MHRLVQKHYSEFHGVWIVQIIVSKFFEIIVTIASIFAGILMADEAYK